MNIVGAIFPLTNFVNRANHTQNSFVADLQSILPFARTCLLRGDADQCFRSLLFQAALSYAAVGKRVDFYTPVPLQNIPSLVHTLVSKSLSAANLHLIQFHYLPTLTEVHKHVVHSSPEIIVIDGYLEYPISKPDDAFQIIAACALLKDTYENLVGRLRKEDLVLLCSCTCDEAKVADVEQRGLFDLAMDIEMLEDGDYRARVQLPAKSSISCAFNFRIGRNEIVPLSAAIEK